MPNDPFFIKKLHLLHMSAEGGHSGVNKALYRVRRNFFSPNLKSAIKEFIRGCDVCQRIKVEMFVPN